MTTCHTGSGGRWVTLCITVAALVGVEAVAGVKETARSLMFWRGSWPETLIVTGNYARPRLLAEQAQRKTDLPIIVVSREAQGDQVFYLPSEPEAMAVPAEKYLEFIEVMIRPKRVIVLGDATHIAAQYVDCLRERYPTIILPGKDWVTNAEQLGKIIGYRRLGKHYHNRLVELLEAEAHRAADAPAMPMTE